MTRAEVLRYLEKATAFVQSLPEEDELVISIDIYEGAAVHLRDSYFDRLIRDNPTTVIIRSVAAGRLHETARLDGVTIKCVKELPAAALAALG